MPGIDDGTECFGRLVGLGLCFPDRVALIEEDGDRRPGADPPVQVGRRGAGEHLRGRAQQLQQFQHAGLAALFLRGRKGDPGRRLELVVEVGMRGPQSDRRQRMDGWERDVGSKELAHLVEHLGTIGSHAALPP